MEITKHYGPIGPNQIGEMYESYINGVADGTVYFNFGTWVAQHSGYSTMPDGRSFLKMTDGEVLDALYNVYNNKVGTTNPFRPDSIGAGGGIMPDDFDDDYIPQHRPYGKTPWYGTWWGGMIVLFCLSYVLAALPYSH